MAECDADIDYFERCKVDALKEFCKKLGYSVIGKRKKELVSLAWALSFQKAPIVLTKQQEREAVNLDYKSLLEIDVDGCHLRIPDPLELREGWENESTAANKWPPCMYIDINNYLISKDEQNLLTRLANDYKEGAFFIPYILFLVTCGIPLFVLETALGQYTSLGGIMCWRKVCPLFEGLGYASQLVIFYGGISYMVILAWAFLYFFSSFSGELPWTSCNNTWNTDECVVINNYNTTANWTSPVNATSSVIEFWQRRVLHISSGIETLGKIQWDLSLCLLLSWVICYFCVWKGVRSTGKATYVTATFPFVMLFVLFVRGMSLPGAFHGIKYYLYPNPARLADPQVWMDAGTQIFYSYAICLGCLTTLGSYNKYNNNCYRDSFYLCLLNSGTSFISGFAIFSVLGYMSQKMGVDITTVAESGPGLVFIVYPQAVTLLPWPQVWSACFFLMIILLGIDGQFAGLESIMTSFTDVFPSHIRKGYRRELCLMLICALCYMFGLLLVSEAGAYILQIFDHYVCSGPTLLLMAIFQSIIIGWIYGAERFCDNIEDMIGYKPLSLFKYCWLYGTPLICSGTLVFLLLRYTPLRFNNSYVYPWWAYCIGWFLAMSSLSLIPITMICKLVKGEGSLLQRFKTSSQPAGDLPVMAKEMSSVNVSLSVRHGGKHSHSKSNANL